MMHQVRNQGENQSCTLMWPATIRVVHKKSSSLIIHRVRKQTAKYLNQTARKKARSQAE